MAVQSLYYESSGVTDSTAGLVGDIYMGYWITETLDYTLGYGAGYRTGYSTERGVLVQEVKLSTAVRVRVTMRANDGSGPLTGLTLTVGLAKNAEGSFTTISPTVTPLGSGVYDIQLTASHTDTLGVASLLITSNTVNGLTAIPETVRLLVVAIDKADAVRMGLTALPNANAEAAGGLITRGVGTGQLNVASGKADAEVAELGAPVGASISADIAAVKADTAATLSAANSIQTTATEIHKVTYGRWKVLNNQLILYDVDGTTVIKTFNLLDDAQQPSSVRIFERVPLP